MEGIATKVLGRATLTKYQALVSSITTWENNQGLLVDWLDPFFFLYLWKTLERYAKTLPLKMHTDRAVIKLHNNLQVCAGDTNFILRWLDPVILRR